MGISLITIKSSYAVLSQKIDNVSALLVIMGASLFCCSACTEYGTTLYRHQRIVVLRQNVPLYQYPDRKWVRFLRQGDTLNSFASRIVADESGLQRIFLVKTNSDIAGVKNDLGHSVETEYEILIRSCDTDFLLSPEIDSIAWERAVRYVEQYSTDVIEHYTSTLIQTGKRLRVDTPLGFVIRRTFRTDGGTRYSIRAVTQAGRGGEVLAAQRCAFFIQTGKSEEEFFALDSAAR